MIMLDTLVSSSPRVCWPIATVIMFS